MTFDPSNTVRMVDIRNSDNYTTHRFYADVDTLTRFREIMLTTPEFPKLEDWGEGVDSMAVLGMSLIFDPIPQKFPVKDILAWLRDDLTDKLPRLTLAEAEAGLVQLAKTATPVYALVPHGV